MRLDCIARKMKTKCILIQISLLCAMLFAVFAVEAQPVITQQPTNQTVILGGSATFNVAVSGTGPFTYRWQFNGTNLPATVAASIITTVAGSGFTGFGYSGDGGAATNAKLNSPFGIAADASGNLFITDTGNNRIRKVSTNGIITTVAGNGVPDYSGDGFSATSASLKTPFSVAVDFIGNLFIADTDNNRIRKVSTNGIITTVAGNGNPTLFSPQGVAVDTKGNVFIADTDNSMIRKVATNGIVTTIAGNGSAGYSSGNGAATNAMLNFPSGIALYTNGNVFIADTGNFRVREVVYTTNSFFWHNVQYGDIVSVAGNGTSGYSGDGGSQLSAMLNNPSGVAVDASGNVFIADRSNHRIRKVDTNGTITTIVGNGTGGYSGDGGGATNAKLYLPFSIAVDARGNLFIADQGNNCNRKVVNSATQPTLILESISTNNVGNYSIIISNASGSATSSIANLTVVAPPIIITHPTNQIVIVWPCLDLVDSVGVTHRAWFS